MEYIIAMIVYLIGSGVVIWGGLNEREEEGPSACTWTEIIFFAGLWPFAILYGLCIYGYFWLQNKWNIFKHNRLR